MQKWQWKVIPDDLRVSPEINRMIKIKIQLMYADEDEPDEEYAIRQAFISFYAKQHGKKNGDRDAGSV